MRHSKNTSEKRLPIGAYLLFVIILALFIWQQYRMMTTISLILLSIKLFGAQVLSMGVNHAKAKTCSIVNDTIAEAKEIISDNIEKANLEFYCTKEKVKEFVGISDQYLIVPLTDDQINAISCDDANLTTGFVALVPENSVEDIDYGWVDVDDNECSDEFEFVYIDDEPAALECEWIDIERNEVFDFITV